MSERSRRQNGTRISNSLAAESNTAASTAARTPAIENNGSEQPKSLLAVYQGKPLRVTLRSLASSTPGGSDASDVHSTSTETEEDAASDSDVLDLQPARRTRASAMRGERPRGYSHQRAAQIDFSSSASIEEHMPPYRGRGDLPFPIHRLLDTRGNVLADKKLCWKKVVAWRKLTQKNQRESIKSDSQLDKALAKEFKKLQAEEKKAEQERDKEARKARRDANRVNNRRNKRARERAMAADTAEEDEGEVEVSLCPLRQCVVGYLTHFLFSFPAHKQPASKCWRAC